MIYLVTNKPPKNSWFQGAEEQIELASVNDVGDWLYDAARKEIAVDTETYNEHGNGLDPHNSHIESIQIGDGEDQFFLDETVDWRFIDEVLEDEDIVKVLHNAAFDYKFLRADRNGYRFNPYHTKGRKILANVFDTMLAEMVLTTGLERVDQMQYLSLVAVAYRHAKAELSKADRFDRGTAKAVIYGCKDIRHLSDIKAGQQKLLTKFGLDATMQLENEAVLAFADMEYNGIKVDVDKWNSVADMTEQAVVKQMAILDKIIIDSGVAKNIRDNMRKGGKGTAKRLVNIDPNDPEAAKKLSKAEQQRKRLLTAFPQDTQTNMFGDLIDTPSTPNRLLNINWNSSQQKLILLEYMGIRLESTNKQFLIKYRSKHPFVKELMTYSEQAKLVSSFGRKFIEWINPATRRVHPHFWQIVSTGRVAQSKPNLLQIPQKGIEGPIIRSAFVAEPGNKIVGGDYSG